MDNIPDAISLDNLFQPMEIPITFPLTTYPALRYWSVKTTMNYLDVSERQIRRYLGKGKLKYIYRTVKGQKRVYISNISAIALKPFIRNHKRGKEENAT